jgi:lysophospholipase L1-like esterase
MVRKVGGVSAAAVSNAVATALANASTISASAVTAVTTAAANLNLLLRTDPGAPTYADIPGVLFAHTDSSGKRSWLEANDTDGGPTDVASQFLATWATNAQISGAQNPLTRGRRNLLLALARIRTRRVNALVIGASNANGSGADDGSVEGMFFLLAKAMQNSWNPVGLAGGFAMKVRDGDWTGGGTGTGYEQRDLKQCIALAPGDQPRTFVTKRQPVDGVEIMYATGSSPFTVVIDGGAPAAVTPDSSGVWVSPQLTLGVHTVTINPPTSGVTVLSNAYFTSGDRSVGLRTYFGTMPGNRSVEALPSGDGAELWARYSQLLPALVIIMLGANDAGGGALPVVSAADYRTNLEALVSEAIGRAAPGLPPWIVLVAQHSTVATFPDYRDAMKSVADAHPNHCTFISFYEQFETTNAAVDASTRNEWMAGETSHAHLSTLGHEQAFEYIATQMQVPSRRTWPVPSA